MPSKSNGKINQTRWENKREIVGKLYQRWMPKLSELVSATERQLQMESSSMERMQKVFLVLFYFTGTVLKASKIKYMFPAVFEHKEQYQNTESEGFSSQRV